jgi:hypothetical protein
MPESNPRTTSPIAKQQLPRVRSTPWGVHYVLPADILKSERGQYLIARMMEVFRRPDEMYG